MTALVTAVGSFSADVVIKNLKKMGFRVVGCDVYPKEWIVDAYQVNAFFQAPYASLENEYVHFVQTICIEEEINYILPLTDIEVDVFNRHRAWFESRGIVLCLSPQSTIEICRNKRAIAEYINQHGSVVNTIQTKRVMDVLDGPSQYPVVCKPYDGRSSQGVKYLYSLHEWNSFIKAGNLEKYIVQPFIPGDIVTVDVVRDEHGNCIAVARKELLRTMNGAGTSVYVYQDTELEDKCSHLAQLLGVIGCVNFEFILDERNHYHFIECNPRFAGGVEFTCLAGYDCVRNHVKAFDQSHIDKFKLQHNQYISRKYEEYVTCVE